MDSLRCQDEMEGVSCTLGLVLFVTVVVDGAINQ